MPTAAAVCTLDAHERPRPCGGSPRQRRFQRTVAAAASAAMCSALDGAVFSGSSGAPAPFRVFVYRRRRRGEVIIGHPFPQPVP
ncbi:hypothetical protein HPB50_010101 [Hyalomma asiaticum]|uniref:Uncharacterized protein n=1 Tax=Hyalomma asiaticum TaxID=266040 RepID=A0ACB7RN95_HYAAI|nr:hypothetical protein HPB50_010101 [Hyalomma asiaticum]